MAKQTGLVRYEGTLDNVKHFRIKGRDGWYASMKGGVSKERIMNDENYARTRENMSEFGGVAMANKGFRSALQGLNKKTADIDFNSRLTKRLYTVLREDTTSQRGQRGIMVTEKSTALEGLEWNKVNPLDSVLSCAYTLTASTDHKSATVKIDKMLPSDSIAAPKGATHFRVVLLAHAMSDYSYDAEEGVYGEMNLEANSNGTVATSDYIALDEEMSSAVELTAAVTIDDLENVTNYASLGIQFFQKIGTVQYALRECDAMKTLKAL